MNKQRFYDGGTMLSYRKHINIIMGHRSTGKTFWAKKRAIVKFLKTGKGCVWIRRYKTHLKKAKLQKFFYDIIEANNARNKPWFPKNTELKIDGYTAYCNGKPFIAFVPLSCANGYKSVPFNDCDDLYFDEVFVDKSSDRYISHEFDIFNEYVLTFMRERFDNVNIFLLSNAISLTNPYFIGWNIRISNNEFSFDPSRQVLVQNFKSEEIIQSFDNSWYGQLMKGTNYYNYAINNEFLRDNSDFIEKKPQHAQYKFALCYNGQTLGVWLDYKNGIFYLSNKFDPNYPAQYAITRDDHTYNTYLIKNKKNITHIRALLSAFNFGDIRFTDAKVKGVGMEAISYLFNV